MTLDDSRGGGIGEAEDFIEDSSKAIFWELVGGEEWERQNTLLKIVAKQYLGSCWGGERMLY